MYTKVVVFDLGGVLVELSGVPMFSGWIGESREDEVWRRWLACPWVRRFERGECSSDAFARGMVEEWQLPLEPSEFLAHFRNWPAGLYPGARDLVRGLRGRLQLACLSNTNELHWDQRFCELGVDALFDASFLSHRMKLVKPDRAAFEHVVEQLDVAPREVLFLDDNQINVDAARQLGIDAERTLGVEGARGVLAGRGLL